MRKMDADRARAKELFQQMSTKQKIRHIVGYYWLHAVVCVAVVAVAISVVNSYRVEKERSKNLFIGLQDEYSSVLEPQVLALAEEAGWTEELNRVFFAGGGAGNTQMVLYLAADQIDFIVCDFITMRMITEDETIVCDVKELEQTPLGARVDLPEDMYVITLNDTARYEKVQQFAPFLAGPLQ